MQEGEYLLAFTGAANEWPDFNVTQKLALEMRLEM